MSPVTWGFEKEKDYKIKGKSPPSQVTTEQIVRLTTNKEKYNTKIEMHLPETKQQEIDICKLTRLVSTSYNQ